MDIANDELETISGISDDNKNINGEQITQALAEIKKEMAENKPATKEDVQKIVEGLSNLLTVNVLVVVRNPGDSL